MQHESVFSVFPNLPECNSWTSGERLMSRQLRDVFVDFMAETHNMIAVGRRLGGFLIFGRTAGKKAAFAVLPGCRFRRRI